jgi:hypothetical protein
MKRKTATTFVAAAFPSACQHSGFSGGLGLYRKMG